MSAVCSVCESPFSFWRSERVCTYCSRAVCSDCARSVADDRMRVCAVACLPCLAVRRDRPTMQLTAPPDIKVIRQTETLAVAANWNNNTKATAPHRRHSGDERNDRDDSGDDSGGESGGESLTRSDGKTPMTDSSTIAAEPPLVPSAAAPALVPPLPSPLPPLSAPSPSSADSGIVDADVLRRTASRLLQKAGIGSPPATDTSLVPVSAPLPPRTLTSSSYAVSPADVLKRIASKPKSAAQSPYASRINSPRSSSAQSSAPPSPANT